MTCKLGCLSCCARLHPRLLVYLNCDSSFELRQMLSTAGTQFLHLSECSCYVWLTIWFNCPDLTRTWCQNLCWFVASYCMDEVLFKAHTVKTKAVKCFRVKCREAVLAVDARKSVLAVDARIGTSKILNRVPNVVAIVFSIFQFSYFQYMTQDLSDCPWLVSASVALELECCAVFVGYEPRRLRSTTRCGRSRSA